MLEPRLFPAPLPCIAWQEHRLPRYDGPFLPAWAPFASFSTRHPLWHVTYHNGRLVSFFDIQQLLTMKVDGATLRDPTGFHAYPPPIIYHVLFSRRDRPQPSL
jgi:hypothetical protein